MTDLELAYELGQHIAQQGWVLLTGGKNAGVMNEANQGTKSADGLTVGILPSRNYYPSCLYFRLTTARGAIASSPIRHGLILPNQP